MQQSQLILPISILLGCIILGGFFYASQISKQKSIERQQQIELRAKQTELQAKAEQDKREYIAKRKKDCYDIETSERKKFNNVDSSTYDEVNDDCIIRYVNEKWREGDSDSCPTGYQKLFNDKGEPIENKCTIPRFFISHF